MMQLAMALRSSDLTRRIVRDVDLDGTQLIIEDGKSDKSNEPRVIPEKLQPYVRQLVAGRSPMEPLFKTPHTKDGHHSHHWMWQAQERFCRLAGVPHFCPHSLKGVSGTVIAKRGAAGNIVMDHLSHEEDATTFRHYVDRGLVEGAQAEQAFRVIAGGRR
jgi:integrase